MADEPWSPFTRRAEQRDTTRRMGERLWGKAAEEPEEPERSEGESWLREAIHERQTRTLRGRVRPPRDAEP